MHVVTVSLCIGMGPAVPNREARGRRSRYRVEARAGPHPAGTAIAATALAGERFAEKRASGSRSRQVGRCLRNRPEASVRQRAAALLVIRQSSCSAGVTASGVMSSVGRPMWSW
jgi:hypothetical protein